MESCILPNSIELILTITCQTSFPTIETLALLKNNIGLPIYMYGTLSHIRMETTTSPHGVQGLEPQPHIESTFAQKPTITFNKIFLTSLQEELFVTYNPIL
jgi:hypothetical protein